MKQKIVEFHKHVYDGGKIILPFFNLGVSWKVATVLVRDAIWEAVDGRMKLVDKEVEERTAIQDIVSFGPRKYANYIQ